MDGKSVSTEKCRELLAQITALTITGKLHWEKPTHTSYRYADWNEILLFLGPNARVEDKHSVRYLHFSPLFLTEKLEFKSDDPKLHNAMMALIYAVEAATEHQKSSNPFALTNELLKRFKT